jgi:hypothetical protein
MLASVYSKSVKTLIMRLSFVTTILFTLLNTTMSLLTLDQFEDFIDEFPEMEQCYDLSRYDTMDASEEELIANA